MGREGTMVGKSEKEGEKGTRKVTGKWQKGRRGREDGREGRNT